MSDPKKAQEDISEQAKQRVQQVLAGASQEAKEAGWWVIRKDGKIIMNHLPLSDYKSEDDLRRFIESELASKYKSGIYHIYASDPLGKKKIEHSDLYIKIELDAIGEVDAMVEAAQRSGEAELEKMMSLKMKQDMIAQIAGGNRKDDELTKKLIEALGDKKGKGGDEMSPMMMWLLTQNQTPATNPATLKNEIMEGVNAKLEALATKLQPQESESDKMFKTMMMKKLLDGDGEKKGDSMITLLITQMKEDSKRREDETKTTADRMRTEQQQAEQRHKEEVDRRERERKEELSKYERERKEDKEREEKRLQEERRRYEDEMKRRDKDMDAKEAERRRQENYDREFQVKMFQIIKDGNSSNVKDIIEIAKTNTHLLTQAGTSMFNAQVNATKSLIEIGGFIKKKFDSDDGAGKSKVVEKVIEAVGQTAGPLIEMNKKLEILERARTDPALASLLGSTRQTTKVATSEPFRSPTPAPIRTQESLQSTAQTRTLSGGVDMLIEKFVKEAPDIIETMAYSIENKDDPIILVDMVIRHANVRTVLATWPFKRLIPRIQKALPDSSMDQDARADVLRILGMPEAEPWWDAQFRPLLREYIQALHEAATGGGEETNGTVQGEKQAPTTVTPATDGKK